MGEKQVKKYNADNNISTPNEYVVRPGFDSDIVRIDNRIGSNETETYTLTYDIVIKPV